MQGPAGEDGLPPEWLWKGHTGECGVSIVRVDLAVEVTYVRAAQVKGKDAPKLVGGLPMPWAT